ncbi:TPA: D-glycerate dehydrogenase [Candidatus Bathyarchaeota archaeon]|nr:D-glycerate dehydrogenase [Candidatus Bathyarchaeota archaeon]
MYKVFVTRRIPEPGLELLRKECEVTINPEDRVLAKDEIIKNVKGKDGLLCLLTDKIDAEVMDAEPKLKVISNYAVGYDNIDVEAATKRGIAVTNTPGVLTDAVADLAWALLMSIARRIVEADRFVRAGRWKGWAPMLMLGGAVHGRTLGIVGLGRIGSAVARRARGFDMKVLYHDVVRREGLERELGLEHVPLEELLRRSDYVTLHVPLLPATYHLIGERELGLMKRSAYLINTSRGPVVDEAALARALEEGRIAGAALDVYEREPKVHESLLRLDNVVLVPHIGSATIETRTKMAMMAAENLLAVLKGKIPPSLVNKEVLKVTPLKP